MNSESVTNSLINSKLFVTGRVLDLAAEAVSLDKKWNPIEFYRTASRLASASVWAEGASILLTDSAQSKVILIASYDESDIKIPGRIFESGKGVAGAVLKSKQIEIHSEIKPHPAFIPSRSKPQIRAVAAAPLINAEQQIIGVLCVHNPIDSDEFSDEAVEMIEAYANALAKGISIVRAAEIIYDENIKLRAEAQIYSLYFDMASKILNGMQRDRILEDFIFSLKRMISAEHLGLFIEENNQLRLITSFKLPINSGKIISRNNKVKGDIFLKVALEVWDKGIPVIEDFRESQRGFDVKSRFVFICGIPISVEDKVIGVLMFAVGPEDDNIADSLIKNASIILNQLSPLFAKL